MLRVGMTNPPYMLEHLPAICELLHHPNPSPSPNPNPNPSPNLSPSPNPNQGTAEARAGRVFNPYP